MKSMLFSMVLALVLFVFQTASVRAGGQTCNGYNYIVLESGVGSNPWRGHIDLKTMQWEAKHHGGGYVRGVVKWVLCSGDKLALQMYDERQHVTSNCMGKIHQNQVEGFCGGAHGAVPFRYKLLKQ
jgi:hypothetical protein